MTYNDVTDNYMYTVHYDNYNSNYNRYIPAEIRDRTLHHPWA